MNFLIGIVIGIIILIPLFAIGKLLGNIVYKRLKY